MGASGKKKVMEESVAEEVAEVVEEPPKKKAKKKEEVEVQEAAPVATEPEVLTPEAYRAKHGITAVRKDQELPDPVQTFDDAPFSKKVREALKAAGFSAPSPIQAQAWPVAQSGLDLVAVAKTGSGKTLAFLLPAFRLLQAAAAENLTSGGPARPTVLVLAPTRELATQTEVECNKFGKTSKVKCQVVYGGVAKSEHVKAMKLKPDMLVATPGRLQDLMGSGSVTVAGVRLVVLDEADRMLDMGFEPEIAKILTEAPKDQRQTLLFTATWPKAVQKISKNYLKDDFVHVNVGQTEELSANVAVSQLFYKLGDDEKETQLWRILADLPDSAKLICFANTKRRIDGLQKSFKVKGFESCALHGDKPQWERDRDLASFSSGSVWLLFATDVCARGLDIKDVTHVVNFDMARDVESYVHRIGRTGRAGALGASITFWNEAYDMECAPALAKIAREAGQPVPDFLEKAAAKQKAVKNKAWRY